MILYHATFRKRLDQIRKNGLGARQPKNWQFSEKGVIYFAQDYDVAESFCECAEEVADDVYDSGIVVLAVDTNTLKMENFRPDENIKQEGYSGCYIYKGTIVAQKIRVVQRRTHNGKTVETYTPLK